MEEGNGPGINSGRVLEDMIGGALKEKCGNESITMKQVLGGGGVTRN